MPAIERLIQLDSTGREQLRVLRNQEPVVGSGIDYSSNPRFTAARGRPIWLSPAYFDGLDPFISIAMPHSGRDAGSTVAEISLKFVSSFIDSTQIGKDLDAYVVGPEGRLLANSNLDVRLGTSFADLPQVRAVTRDKGEPLTFGTDLDGRSVLTASAAVPLLDWHVFFEQPRTTALPGLPSS